LENLSIWAQQGQKKLAQTPANASQGSKKVLRLGRFLKTNCQKISAQRKKVLRFGKFLRQEGQKNLAVCELSAKNLEKSLGIGEIWAQQGRKNFCRAGAEKGEKGAKQAKIRPVA
jgi:hypothetical protein